MRINQLIKTFILINILIYSSFQSKPTLASSVLLADNETPQSYDQPNNQKIAQYTDESREYYQRGINFYNSNEYTKAITEFEQALKLNSQDASSRINLAAAHIARGGYFFKLDFIKAANDYRKAIFYLKYDENLPEKSKLEENLHAAEVNLSNLFTEYKMSSNPKSRLKMAKELRGQGYFKESTVEYNAALADSASRLDIYKDLGDIMRVLQKDTKAVEYYQNAINLDPNNEELHLKIARALSQTGNTDAAVKEFNLALNLNENNKEIVASLENIWKTKLRDNPGDAMAHMNLGVVFQKKGDLQAALAEYKMAESIEPNNFTIRLNLGTLFQALGDIPMALKAYDTILQANPADPLAHYYRATALKQMGNIRGAIDEFQIVLKIDPNNNSAKKAMFEAVKMIPNPDESMFVLNNLVQNYGNDAQTQYNFAYELHTNKKIEEALPYYQKAISLDPKLIDAYLNVASIYREKKQYSEALATLQNAMVVNPNNAKIKTLLSQIQEETTVTRYEEAVKRHNNGDYTGAIQDYLRIIEENEATPDIYISLGAAYQAIDKNTEAQTAYSKALKLDPNNPLAHYYIGTIYFEQKKYDNAISSYQKALNGDPNNTDIKDALKAARVARNDGILEKGLNEYNAQRYVKALEIFNLVINSDPNNGYAYYYRGMVYDAQKKYLTAIEDYKKAIAKSSDLNLAYYMLGVDYDTLNLKAEAKKAYQKFVTNSKDQNDEYVKYAKQRLEKLK